jgi:hypothetical protein
VTVYQIAVQPLPIALDKDGAKTRATKIGALVGLGTPDTTLQDPSSPSGNWLATWSGSIDGYPVDPAGVTLEMDAYGVVIRFRRITGPTKPVPDPLITEAEARSAALAQGNGTIDTARLAWRRLGMASTYQLMWELHHPNIQPDGTDWSCIVYVDAGTATVLDVGCIV